MDKYHSQNDTGAASAESSLYATSPFTTSVPEYTIHDNLVTELNDLASSCDALAGSISTHVRTCGNPNTAIEIGNVGDEFTNIAQTLFDLSNTIKVHSHCCTDALREDIKHNTDELTLFIREVSECAEELTEKGPCEYWSYEIVPVPWFFKEGRVMRMIHHIYTLGAQLNLMRTFILDSDQQFHGSEPRALKSETHSVVREALQKARKAARESFELEYRCYAESVVLNTDTVDTHNGSNNTQNGGELLTISEALVSTEPETSRRRAQNDSVMGERGFTLRAQHGVYGPLLDVNVSHEDLRRRWVRDPASRLDRLAPVPEANNEADPFTRHANVDIISPIATHPQGTINPARDLEAQQNQSEPAIQRKKSNRVKILHSSKKKVSKFVHKFSSSLPISVRRISQRRGGNQEGGAYTTIDGGSSSTSTLQAPNVCPIKTPPLWRRIFLNDARGRASRRDTTPELAYDDFLLDSAEQYLPSLPWWCRLPREDRETYMGFHGLEYPWFLRLSPFQPTTTTTPPPPPPPPPPPQ